MGRGTVLIVDADDAERDVMGEWLEAEGYDVMFCSGPRAPDYTCLGGRDLPCPLAKAADIVVIDLALRSDMAMAGTPGWILMLYYYQQRKRIVALTRADDPVRPKHEDPVAVVRRPFGREALVRAVRESELFVSLYGTTRTSRHSSR